MVEMTDRDYEIQDVVVAIAKEVNHSPGQVALNYVLGVRRSLLRTHAPTHA